MKSILPRSRRLLTFGALASLGALTVGACASEPSPKRVALDMVETLDDLSDSERDCMTQKIDEDYTPEQIARMGADNSDFDFANPAGNEGDEAGELNAFISDLRSCHS